MLKFDIKVFVNPLIRSEWIEPVMFMRNELQTGLGAIQVYAQ